jgi:hypothetical protein
MLHCLALLFTPLLIAADDTSNEAGLYSSLVLPRWTKVEDFFNLAGNSNEGVTSIYSETSIAESPLLAAVLLFVQK